MKFLLVGINAKYIHSNPGIYSLKAYAERVCTKEAEIVLAEYTINQMTDEIRRGIYEARPDWIGFSCYIWNIEIVKRLVSELRLLLPEVPIWLGGPEVSFHTEEFLWALPAVTGIMAGEGELLFAKLVNDYVSARQENANLQLGPVLIADEILDMDTLPFPYKDMKDFENRIVYYESARGCPFGCAYCLSSIDKRMRFRSLSLVKEELAFFLAAKVPQVKFIDRTFNCSPVHAMEILRFIKECDNGTTNFHFEIAADLLREEELEILQSLRPGLVQLEIGVQTTNLQVLHRVGRFSDLRKIQENTKKLLKNGNIHLHLDLIAGLPGEDYASFVRSFNEVFAMGGHELQLGFLKLLKGSPMEQMVQQYGIVTEQQPPYELLYTKDLTYAEVLKLKDVTEMLELYHNSQQFTFIESQLFPEVVAAPVELPKFLPSWEEHGKAPFAFYEGLGCYYQSRKEPAVNSKRARRYEMLLEYLVDEGYEASVVRNLLTLDYYLRENAKARPAFAGEAPEASEFYRREAEQPRYLTGYEGTSWKQLMRMTHLEQLQHPERPEEVWTLVFDYRRRNPVTGGVEVICNVE